MSAQVGFFLLIPVFSSLMSTPELEKAENETLAMRKQSEGLTKEYDRLLEEHMKLQVSMPWLLCWMGGPSYPATLSLYPALLL